MDPNTVEPRAMDTRDKMKALPAVGRLLQSPALAAFPRWAAVEGARAAVDRARAALLAGGDAPTEAAVLEAAIAEARRRSQPTLRPVVNATGVVVHTNLGRAPLSDRAVDAVAAIAAGYSTLEYDLETGARGSRGVHAAARLKALTGAPAALVVNNNAAAVFLALTALAAGREVIVSRGELVEIGGSFRVPDILAAGGARLKEVGTTNRTRIADYERAITDDTALLLKVHASNFRIQGFTEAPSRAELVALGRARGVPVMEDLGSGALLPAALRPGGWDEPDVAEVVASGVDLLTFSGDKLLGGPQAGIILGEASLVARLKAHPLARALRVGKLTLAALEATLAAYMEGSIQEIPVIAALTATGEALRERAEALLETLMGQVPDFEHRFDAQLEAEASRGGGGSLPGVDLPTTVVALTPLEASAAAVEADLRRFDPPVICRVREGRILLDPRALGPGDDALIAAALRATSG